MRRLLHGEEQKKECKELKEAYNDVCQETYKDPGKGYVKVEFLSDTEDMPYMEHTLHHLGEEVEPVSYTHLDVYKRPSFPVSFAGNLSGYEAQLYHRVEICQIQRL